MMAKGGEEPLELLSLTGTPASVPCSAVSPGEFPVLQRVWAYAGERGLWEGRAAIWKL